MNYVIDASVAIKWFIPEIHWRQAVKLQSYSDAVFYAPDFLQLECTSILSKKVRRNELKLDDANQIQELLLQMPMQFHPWQKLLIDAGQVAHQTYRSVYDCLYLVLSKQLEGKMVTADKKFYNALQHSNEWGQYLLWVEDIVQEKKYHCLVEHNFT